MSHARVVHCSVTRWSDDIETNISRGIGFRIKDGDTYLGPTRLTRQEAVEDLAAYKAHIASRPTPGEVVSPTGAAEASGVG